jgi:hypothetical protein
MSYDLDPVAGNWYQHLDKGLDFEVVAVDEDNATIELQYVDGTLDEISLDEWYEMDLEPAEPPEDWSGPIDDEDADDTDQPASDAEGEDEDEWDDSPRGRRRGGRTDDFDEDAAGEFGGDWDE